MADNDTNARLAVVENTSNSNSRLLTTMGETVIQLRIIAETSQKLLESHDKGIADLHRRESEREHRNDERREQDLDRIHQLQNEVEKKRNEDLLLLHNMTLKVENCEKSIGLNKGDEKDLDNRVRLLENWKWKVAGVLAILTFTITLAAPYIMKLFQ